MFFGNKIVFWKKKLFFWKKTIFLGFFFFWDFFFFWHCPALPGTASRHVWSALPAAIFGPALLSPTFQHSWGRFNSWNWNCHPRPMRSRLMDNKKKKEKKAPLPPPPPPLFLFCGYLISWKITFGKNHFVNFDFQAYPLKNPRVTISFPTKKRFFQAVLERTPGNISNKSI